MPFNPLKKRQYGTTKAVISELFKEAGGIPKIMEVLEIGRTRAYDFTDPNGDAELSFERVEEITRATGATIAAEHLAHLAGGVYLPINSLDASGEEVDWHSLAARASLKNAANISAIMEFLGPESPTPGEIDPKEAHELIKKVDRHFSVLAHQRQMLMAVIEEEELK